jgi:EAL domain-containing protein (putative c-di-GMP-specific phosphodiesterase class I)
MPGLGHGFRGAGADPRRMQLGVTESMLLDQDAVVMQWLMAIETTGMSIALDDFGTGCASLTGLQRFAIRTLKIEETFVQGIDAHRPLAETIVSMAQPMRPGVVNESMETVAQLESVRARDIDGWPCCSFSRPLPASAFTGLLRRAAAAAGDSRPAEAQADAAVLRGPFTPRHR